jgi:hypothetical protein
MTLSTKSPVNPLLADLWTTPRKGFATRNCVIARCLTRSLSGNLSTMTEWTPEAIRAEIDYRRSNAQCNWQRSNGRMPSWLRRVIHPTTAQAAEKHGSTRA